MLVQKLGANITDANSLSEILLTHLLGHDDLTLDELNKRRLCPIELEHQSIQMLAGILIQCRPLTMAEEPPIWKPRFPLKLVSKQLNHTNDYRSQPP